jgi:tetratricopeptide (TPR) repeat protein
VFAFADHNVRLDRALQLAQGELEFRRDVYSYDALAWTLYKNGRYSEAQDYMQKALVLKTPEPMFHQHAEAISKALKSGTGPERPALKAETVGDSEATGSVVPLKSLERDSQ